MNVAVRGTAKTALAERMQAGRSAAYADVLEHAYRTLAAAARIEPVAPVEGQRLQFPSDHEVRVLSARVASAGGKALAGQLLILSRLAAQLVGDAYSFREIADSRRGSPAKLEYARGIVEARREEVNEAVERAIELANGELSEES